MKLALTVLVAMLWLLAPFAALAGQGGSEAAVEPEGEQEIALEDALLRIGTEILDQILYYPIYAGMILIGLIAVVVAVLSGGAVDRCLGDFEGYPVTLELKDGAVYHGELDVEKTGLEFLYEKTTPQEGATKTSFLIYRPEYRAVHALIRYPDRLNDEQIKARERGARKAYHPNVFRRTRRGIRNFFAGIKDSIYTTFGLGPAEPKEAPPPAAQAAGKPGDRSGAEALGTAAAKAFDPLLEKQIGLRVVLALTRGAGAHDEFVGTFREYNKDFFELMDVDYRSRWQVALAGAGATGFVRGIAAQRTADGIRIENCNTFDVHLASVEVADASGPAAGAPATVASGEKLALELAPDAGSAALTFASTRKADLIVPRAAALIRHKSEWVEPKKFVGSLQEAVGLLPGTDRVVSVLRQGAQFVTRGPQRKTLPFVKLHGCGNDYIYVDCRERALEDPAALARRVSDRHFGVGGDGLILILPSERADFRMRMFNADGSEAEMCGNGLRGFAKYLYDRRLIKGEQAQIETGAGVLSVEIFPEEGKARRVRINMGAPRLERGEIPMAGEPGRVIGEELSIDVPGEGTLPFACTAVSMGNPHCVIYVDAVDDYPVATYGPLLENHPAFPKRANIEFVQVLSRGEVKMRVWERGSGETLACGTGASAVCVASALNDKADRKVVVHLLGGDLELEWADEGSVYLTGPAEEVFAGTIEL